MARPVAPGAACDRIKVKYCIFLRSHPSFSKVKLMNQKKRHKG